MNAPAVNARLRGLLDDLNNLGSRDTPPDLKRSHQALRDIADFLEGEFERSFGVDALDALSPLYDLINALSDTLNGGRPELLRPTNQKKGAPGNQAKHLAQGAMAAAMDCLIFAGVQRVDAAKFVADEANKRGIGDQKGEKIKPKQVANWRSRVGDDLSPGATNLHSQTFRQFREIIAAAPEAQRRAVAEDLVKDVLAAVRNRRVSPTPGGFPT